MDPILCIFWQISILPLIFFPRVHLFCVVALTSLIVKRYSRIWSNSCNQIKFPLSIVIILVQIRTHSKSTKKTIRRHPCDHRYSWETTRNQNKKFAIFLQKCCYCLRILVTRFGGNKIVLLLLVQTSQRLSLQWTEVLINQGPKKTIDWLKKKSQEKEQESTNKKEK